MIRTPRAIRWLWMVRFGIFVSLLYHLIAVRIVFPGAVAITLERGCVAVVWAEQAKWNTLLCPYLAMPGAYAVWSPGVIPFLDYLPARVARIPLPIFTIGFVWLMFLAEEPKRARHERGYCRQCGHKVRGLTQPRCPECGRAWGPVSPWSHRK